jgi:hypothetical protein
MRFTEENLNLHQQLLTPYLVYFHNGEYTFESMNRFVMSYDHLWSILGLMPPLSRRRPTHLPPANGMVIISNLRWARGINFNWRMHNNFLFLSLDSSTWKFFAIGWDQVNPIISTAKSLSLSHVFHLCGAPMIDIYLLSLYLSVKRRHHVRREGVEIPTLVQKREEYTPLDFMKIWRSRLK